MWAGERESGGDFGGQNDNTVTPTSIATPLKSGGKKWREREKECGSKKGSKREKGVEREREACRGIRKKAEKVEEWDKKGSED